MILPHQEAAYNLARWLTRNDQDAEDIVQEAYLRAFQYFAGFQGGDSRAWLLKIVRNRCYTWLKQNRASDLVSLDDETQQYASGEDGPEQVVLRQVNTALVRQALEELPAEFREVIILREMEGLSYREIAAVIDAPIGTVMSRLARARKRLERRLAEYDCQE